MSVSKSALEIWLGFIASLVWPATIVLGLSMFRIQISKFIDRATNVKFAWGEFTAIQSAVSDAKESPPAKKADVINTGNGACLTETGVRTAIRESGDFVPNDEIYRTMRIFSTLTQTTWLVFSKSKIFLVLDDETTRASGRLVQWVLPRDQNLTIVARPRSPGLGLLDIGPRKNWLYSTNLFATAEYLQVEVSNAIKEGDRATG